MGKRWDHRVWGDLEFVPRAEAWLQAVEDDRDLTDQARAALKALATRYGRNRCHLEALIAAHPEIVDIPLPRPIVVSGLPRSGTTALARLLSGGPVRSLPYWEAAEPFSSLDSREARWGRAAREFRLQDRIMPRLRQFHPCGPDGFTDDQELQGLAFGSFMLEWQAHVPGWRDRYLAEDQAPVYRYLRRAMQALTFLRGPARWVIKSPQHIEQLPALAAAFPDALLVVTKRGRSAVDRSMARLIAYYGSHTRTRLIPARYWPERFDVMSERYGASTGLFPDRLEFDLADWSGDQSATRATVYELAGLNLPMERADI